MNASSIVRAFTIVQDGQFASAVCERTDDGHLVVHSTRYGT